MVFVHKHELRSAFAIPAATIPQAPGLENGQGTACHPLYSGCDSHGCYCHFQNLGGRSRRPAIPRDPHPGSRKRKAAPQVSSTGQGESRWRKKRQQRKLTPMWLLLMLLGLLVILAGFMLLLCGNGLGATALLGLPIAAGGIALIWFGRRMRRDVVFRLNRGKVTFSCSLPAVEVVERFRQLLERGGDDSNGVRVLPKYSPWVDERAFCFWVMVKGGKGGVSLKCSGEFHPAEKGEIALVCHLRPSPWDHVMLVLPCVIACAILWSKHWLAPFGVERGLVLVFCGGLGALGLAWLFVVCPARGRVRKMLDGVLSSAKDT